MGEAQKASIETGRCVSAAAVHQNFMPRKFVVKRNEGKFLAVDADMFLE